MLTSDITIQTIVSSYAGGTNNVAMLNIMAAGTSNNLYSATMISTNPNVNLPAVVKNGNTTIAAGGTFTLTEPSPLQNGFVTAGISYSTGTSGPQAYNGQVASWSLTST